MDGGIICPNVPEAHINPEASFLSYPRLSIVGNVNKPIVTTVAPTIPVDAANKAPTIITVKPNPPLNFPNKFAIVSNNSCAILDFSKIKPININNGTATNNSLVIVPKIFDGIKAKKSILMKPKKDAVSANKIAVPAKVNATGKPNNKKANVVTNMQILNI